MFLMVFYPSNRCLTNCLTKLGCSASSKSEKQNDKRRVIESASLEENVRRHSPLLAVVLVSTFRYHAGRRLHCDLTILD
jgi:hypothetical protein